MSEEKPTLFKCPRCLEDKEESGFYSHSKYACRKCVQAKAKIYRDSHKDKVYEKQKRYLKRHAERRKETCRKYYEKNREKILAKVSSEKKSRNAWDRRIYHIKRHYGLTEPEYVSMLERQGGLCVICGLPPHDGRFLVVDHDHDSGAVRDLLCLPCNSRLGVIEKTPDLIVKMIEYLEAWDLKLASKRNSVDANSVE